MEPSKKCEYLIDEDDKIGCGEDSKYYSEYLKIYICKDCVGRAAADYDNGEDLKLKKL